MFCQKCGVQIVEGAAFCQKCGTKVVYADDTQHSADVPVSDADGPQEGVVATNNRQVLADRFPKLNEILHKGAGIGPILFWGALILLLPFWSLRINSAILVFAAAIGIILSSFGSKRILGVSKKIELVVAVILLVVIFSTSMASGGKNDKYVQMVKNGTLNGYPQMTVGKAFDDFLDNPKWESGLSEDNVRFVNVKGGILYYDKEAEIVVQFLVDEETGSFQYNACEINGLPQNHLVFWGLLENIYNSDSTLIE